MFQMPKITFSDNSERCGSVGQYVGTFLQKAEFVDITNIADYVATKCLEDLKGVSNRKFDTVLAIHRRASFSTSENIPLN